MSSILFAVAIVCAIAAILMLVFKPYDFGARAKQDRKIENPSGRSNTSKDTRWRSVKIRPGLIACKYVTDINDEIFLSQEAPSLPLEGCTEEDCRCHYIFFDDRRSGTDRRIDLGKLDEFLPNIGQNRRSLPGRRATDVAA